VSFRFRFNVIDSSDRTDQLAMCSCAGDSNDAAHPLADAQENYEGKSKRNGTFQKKSTFFFVNIQKRN
jgi:hypothetical protein